jgi:alkanesulfonate monooxygenase SsuD/methylene tetrahydromethanopterin reductase-like flavin-dependent oxidoreductase (luciferase family)
MARTAEIERPNCPLYNDQKLKLGLFGTNCSNGLTVSHAETTYRATWEHSLAIAQPGDAMGFEMLVPIARWRGFGGTNDFNGICFETYTWAAGLAAATESIMVFSTSHVPTVHPIVAAKHCVTVDHISNGASLVPLVLYEYMRAGEAPLPDNYENAAATRKRVVRDIARAIDPAGGRSLGWRLNWLGRYPATFTTLNFFYPLRKRRDRLIHATSKRAIAQ